MLWKLGLLFTVVPLVETWLLIEVGQVIGPLPTVLLLLLDGVLGAWLAKREGAGILRQLMADLGKGLPPAVHLVEGALVLVGAVLLVTPGLVTDVAGFALLLPPIRRRLAPIVMNRLVGSFLGEGVQFGQPRPTDRSREEPRPESGVRQSPFNHPIR